MHSSLALLQAQPAPGFSLGSLAPLILMALLAWVLFWPIHKERKAKESMRAGLKAGDRILTLGGIYGTVTRLEDRSVTLRIADGVQVQLARSAVATILKPEAEE